MGDLQVYSHVPLTFFLLLQNGLYAFTHDVKVHSHWASMLPFASNFNSVYGDVDIDTENGSRTHSLHLRFVTIASYYFWKGKRSRWCLVWMGFWNTWKSSKVTKTLTVTGVTCELHYPLRFPSGYWILCTF